MPKRKTADKEFRDLTQEIDVKALQESVRTFFENFQDPRRSPTYPAWYLILVMLSGYLSGCNTIADLAHFAELRGQWLNNLLGLKFDRISYDTIWWFLVRVKPTAFQDLITQWLSALPSNLKDQVLAVDGKRLRGISDNEHITHLVNLFAVASRITIAQVRVPDKECERKALPQLLESVDVTGAIITMDAHYTYKPDLQKVIDKGADYIVGIKGNQGNLEAEVSAIRSARENKEILLFPLERKSESSNFLLIFGAEKFRSVYTYGSKKFQAWLKNLFYFLKQNANPLAFLIGNFSSDIHNLAR